MIKLEGKKDLALKLIQTNKFANGDASTKTFTTVCKAYNDGLANQYRLLSELMEVVTYAQRLEVENKTLKEREEKLTDILIRKLETTNIL